MFYKIASRVFSARIRVPTFRLSWRKQYDAKMTIFKKTCQRLARKYLVCKLVLNVLKLFFFVTEWVKKARVLLLVHVLHAILMFESKATSLPVQLGFTLTRK
jgi:hypothetical protein